MDTRFETLGYLVQRMQEATDGRGLTVNESVEYHQGAMFHQPYKRVEITVSFYESLTEREERLTIGK